jgi:4-hydroxy-tetrahydrodipicolinate synthase
LGLRGVYPAQVTPFADDGAIDEPAFVRLMAWHESVGCAGIVVSGTNGEAASMTLRERRSLISLAATHRGRLQVIAGTGCACLGETIHLTNHAADEGCDAAMVMPPFYFKDPPQDGVRGYCEKLLEAARLPVLLYNIPRLTDTTFALETLEALKGAPNLAGVKDSSGDRDYLLAVARMLPDRCVMTGAENLLLDCLRAGGAGTVSGAANAYPELAVAVVEAFDAGRDATVAQKRLTEMNAVLRTFPAPAGAKAVLRARGLPGGRVRLPLMDLDEAATANLLTKLSALGLPVTAGP